MDFPDIIPGSLVSPGNSDCEWVATLIYYIVAFIVFFVYAYDEFCLGAAILYSLFWPFGFLYSLIF